MAQRQSLVRQHLENIGRDALESYQDLIRDFVRGQYGVYALYRGRRLRYVGLASDLAVRLKAHLADRHAHLWDRFSVYLTGGGEHLTELESLVLRIVRPKDNRQVGKFVSSENLRPRLRREFREHHRRQEDKLFGLVIPLPPVERLPASRRAGLVGSKAEGQDPGRSKRLTGLDAVAQILREAGRPMTAKDMVQAALDRGLWTTTGRTPDRTIYAAITRDMAARGRQSRFRKGSNGKFALARGPAAR